ncbi:hypothetical protein RvY_09445-2 [Ramazzottius varieornatus]|uniref:Serine/threonine specific protein phosphatases domain-containing protein n=1 Tax=Ramazzottius varieornatus TaxID=947166 RepID=A0A1D1VIH8_RAMVA|nr:hypothetical protein RvY_09445-2 [Ramazzottius varieornatus]
MHGGLSPDLEDLDQIRRIARPLDVPDSGLVCDLLWSDPVSLWTELPVRITLEIAYGLRLDLFLIMQDEDITGWGENDRGVSYTFGGDIVRQYLKKLDCSCIVRAHQVVEDGYQFFQKRKLVTLFSAPNYCGEFDNAGAVMIVDESLTCSFSILPPDKAKILGDNKDKK